MRNRKGILSSTFQTYLLLLRRGTQPAVLRLVAHQVAICHHRRKLGLHAFGCASGFLGDGMVNEYESCLFCRGYIFILTHYFAYVNITALAKTSAIRLLSVK